MKVLDAWFGVRPSKPRVDWPSCPIWQCEHPAATRYSGLCDKHYALAGQRMKGLPRDMIAREERQQARLKQTAP